MGRFHVFILSIQNVENMQYLLGMGLVWLEYLISCDVEFNISTISVVCCSKVNFSIISPPFWSFNSSPIDETISVSAPNLNKPKFLISINLRALESNATDSNATFFDSLSIMDSESSRAIQIVCVRARGLVRRSQIRSLWNLEAMYGIIFLIFSRFPVR